MRQHVAACSMAERAFVLLDMNLITIDVCVFQTSANLSKKIRKLFGGKGLFQRSATPKVGVVQGEVVLATRNEKKNMGGPLL